MNNKLIGVLAFVFGAAAGSISTWAILKKKYDQRIADIDLSYKEFTKRNSSNDTTEVADDNVISAEEPVKSINDINRELAEKARQKPDLIEYVKSIKDGSYMNYTGIFDSEEEDEVDSKEEFSEFDDFDDEGPRLINSSEFGEYADYGHHTLTFYADGFVCDDDDEIIEDVDDVIGLDSLDHFDDYDGETVFVRNDALRCDYEIIRDSREYTDVARKRPRMVEIE